MTDLIPVLEARNLSRSFQGQLAIENLSLSLFEGEVVGLLGPNGAGKTTALKLLAGLLAPSTGAVYLDGQPLPRDRGHPDIGYLPEHPGLYPQYSVQQQLQFVSQLYRLPQAQATSRIQELVESLQLTALLQRRTDHLSKGERQRVGLAQTLVQRPRVLLLDEPTDGLDPGQIIAFRELVQQHAQGCAVLLSTHQLNEIEQLCSRVLILHQGRQCYAAAMGDLDAPLETIFLNRIYRDAVETHSGG